MQELEQLEEELREVASDDYYDCETVEVDAYPMDDFGCAQITLKGEFVNVDGVRTYIMNSDDWYCTSCALTSDSGELRITIDSTKMHKIEAGELER